MRTLGILWHFRMCCHSFCQVVQSHFGWLGPQTIADEPTTESSR